MSLFQTTVTQLSPSVWELLPSEAGVEDPIILQQIKANALSAKVKEVYPAVEILPDNDVNSLRILGLFHELSEIQRSLDSWAKRRRFDPYWNFATLDFLHSQGNVDQSLQTDVEQSVDAAVQTEDLPVVPLKSTAKPPPLSTIDVPENIALSESTDSVFVTDIKLKKQKSPRTYRGKKRASTIETSPDLESPKRTRKATVKSYKEDDTEEDEAEANNDVDDESKPENPEDVYRSMLNAMLNNPSIGEQENVLSSLKTESPEVDTLDLPSDEEAPDLFEDDDHVDNDDDDEDDDENDDVDVDSKIGLAEDAEELSDPTYKVEDSEPQMFEDTKPRPKGPVFSTEGHYNVLMKTNEGDLEVDGDKINSSKMTSVKKLMAFKCKHCGHVTPDKRSLRDHLKRNHTNKPYVCPTCGKGFGLNKDLTRHMLYVHKKVYHCTEQGCLFRGHSQKHLDRHRDVVHLGKPKKRGPMFVKRDQSASCPHEGCDYSTSKRRNLADHIKRSHGEKIHKCPVCNKLYAVKKDLNAHVRNHTETFCCEICGKQLKSKMSLQLHVKNIHEGMNIRIPQKKVLCNTCGKLCRNKTEYKVHMNKEHLNVRPFKCNECDATFFARANLKMHLLVHSDNRNFTCDICGKAFKQRQGLKIHKQIHTSERQYKCDTCSKAFNQKGALTRHLRIHTGEKPYKCKLCTASFNDYSILRRHVLGIHKIDDHVLVRRTASDESVAKSLANNPDLNRKPERKRPIRRPSQRATGNPEEKDDYLKATASMAYMDHPGAVTEVHISQEQSDRMNIILAAAQQSFLGAQQQLQQQQQQQAERNSEVQAAQVLSHLQHPSAQEAAREHGLSAGTVITLPDGRQGTILQQLPPGTSNSLPTQPTDSHPTYLQLGHHSAPPHMPESYMFQGIN